MKKHIVSFSGGKDSTAMLLKMIEKEMQIDRIVCIDTTKEFPQMYEHIEKVKEMITPYKIETIKIDFDYWFSQHIKTKGKNKGTAGYAWPDFRNRWCTSLKQEAFIKSVYSSDEYDPRKRGSGKKSNNNVVEYHGISLDEVERCDKNKGREILYPLVDFKMRAEDCIKYCADRGLDWGGLYKTMSRVSCWCCPLSRIGELRILYSDFPELWSELERMDESSYRCFRSDYSVADLKSKFISGK